MANTKVPASMTSGLLSSTAIGSSVQAKNAKLDQISALNLSNDDILQVKGGIITLRTPTQVTADLIPFGGDAGSGGLKGVVPAPAAGDAAADKFLKADGTWDIPEGSGSGDVIGPSSSTDGAVAVFEGVSGKEIRQQLIADFKTSLALAKADVGLGNVDNTSNATERAATATLTNKTINAASNTISNLATSMFAANVIDTDTTLAADSDTRLATQKAVKAYADGLIEAANALQYKGTLACAANPNYPAASAGHLYIVSSAGKIGGASGLDVEVGDALICKTDSTAAGTHAAVGANWTILQFDLVGALTSANIGSTVMTQRTITGTANQISVSNGDGVSGNPTLSLPADVIIPTIITAPNTGLHVLDTNASHDLIIKPGSDLTVDRTLTLTTGDANRTLTLNGDVNISTFAATFLDDADLAAVQATLGILAGSGALTLLNVQTPSGAASVVFSSTYITTTYDHYLIVFEALGTSVAGAILSADVSINNGSSYINSGYNSGYCRLNSTATVGSGTSTTNFNLGDGNGNTNALGSYSGWLNLVLHNTSFASLYGQIMHDKTSNISHGIVDSASTRVNNIRVQPSTGTITGKVKLIGVQKS